MYFVSNVSMYIPTVFGAEFGRSQVQEFTARVEQALKSDSRAQVLHPLVLGVYASNTLDPSGPSGDRWQLPEKLVKQKLVSKDQRATLLVLIPTSFPSYATFEGSKGSNRTVWAPWLYRKQLIEFLHELLREVRGL